MGAVHEPVFIPLLVVASLAGLASFWRRRREGPGLPGRRLLLALHILVLVQLLPLPPGLLRRVSPGTFSFYSDTSFLSLEGWRPISVNPADTARGFAFLLGMSLLYSAIFLQFRDETWRRRLTAMVVGVGFILTVVALVQAASLRPTTIYGLWRPRWDWGVFGPYVSKNHFAGYLVMAIPLALAFVAESFQALREDWRARRVGWLALGGRAGNSWVRRLAVAMVLVVGLLASRSRGGIVACAVSAAILPLAFRHRRHVAALVLAVALLGLGWVEIAGIMRGLDEQGIRTGRLELWGDAVRMFPRFPLLGAGFNAFGTAYTPYQTVAKYEWYGEAHNEYLQALLDTGVIGLCLFGGLLACLFRPALRSAPASPMHAGYLASLLGLCFHNVVDFNWQIPANAATFAAIAALAMLDPPRGRA